MRYPWIAVGACAALGIAAAGCAPARPRRVAETLRVTWLASAPCPNPVDGLLALKMKRGVAVAVIEDLRRGGSAGGRVAISSRESLATALPDDPMVAAHVRIGGRRVRLARGLAETWRAGAETPAEFVAAARAVFDDLGAGPALWRLTHSGETASTRAEDAPSVDRGRLPTAERVPRFCRALGIGRLKMSAAGPEAGAVDRVIAPDEIAQVAAGVARGELSDVTLSADAGPVRLLYYPNHGDSGMRGAAFLVWIESPDAVAFARAADAWIASDDPAAAGR